MSFNRSRAYVEGILLPMGFKMLTDSVMAVERCNGVTFAHVEFALRGDNLVSVENALVSSILSYALGVAGGKPCQSGSTIDFVADDASPHFCWRVPPQFEERDEMKELPGFKWEATGKKHWHGYARCTAVLIPNKPFVEPNQFE